MVFPARVILIELHKGYYSAPVVGVRQSHDPRIAIRLKERMQSAAVLFVEGLVVYKYVNEIEIIHLKGQEHI